MKHGSLFSGIGGAELAAEWMGWDNIFHCEINPFGRKVLDFYWPNAKSYEDITKTDFSIWRGRIDILTGGFPCQPFSQAGKRKGTEDDRNLWPRMFEVIQQIQPTWVVGENVYGLVNWNGGMVFDQVQADLESIGYQVQPVILPAAAVNAPHRRDRVWIVAYRNDTGSGIGLQSHGKWQAFDERREGQPQFEFRQDGEYEVFADTRNQSGRCAIGCSDQRERELLQNKQQGGEIRAEVTGCCSEWTTPDPNNQGMERHVFGSGEVKRTIQKERKSRYCPDGGVPNWNNFPTVSPICDRNDGLSDRLAGITFPKWRNESIKAMGNAWVPQVAYEIFKVIDKMDNKNKIKRKQK